MSSNNSKKRLEIKNISYISTYNLAKSGINKISSDNKRFLTGFKSEANKNINNSNNIRNNSNSTNKNASKQGKRNKNQKSLNESPNMRLTSPKFLTNNNLGENKGSSTPSESPLMFSINQSTKNKKNKNNNNKGGGINLIADMEKFNKTLKNNEKNIIKKIYTSNLDTNFLLATKHFCKSVGKDSQNFISKRNYTGLLLDQGNKSENNCPKNNFISKKSGNKKNSNNITNTTNNTNNNTNNNIQNNNNLNSNISYNNSNSNHNMNTNNSNQSNSNIINKRNQNNNNHNNNNNNINGLFSSTSTNSINNFLNKNVNNIKTVNLVGTNNNNNIKINNKNYKSNYNIKISGKRSIKTKSAEQNAHNPKLYKNELVCNTNFIINFFAQKNEKRFKNKDIGNEVQKRQNKENKNIKNQNKVLNVPNKLNNLNNNLENISNINSKEKSYMSTTTNNNISTTAGNIPNNIISTQKDNINKNDDLILDELNLEEVHFYIVKTTQNFKKCELDF